MAEPVAWVSVLIAVTCAFLCAALGGLIYSVITITLRANQNVTGLALTIFGTGFGNFFGELMGNAAGGYVAVGAATKEGFNNALFPALANIPVIGKLLFSYNFMVYLSVALALALAFFLNHTRKGLNLRAVGERHAAADAAGISVSLYKYLATCIGGGISGLGGLYIVMNSSNGVGGRVGARLHRRLWLAFGCARYFRNMESVQGDALCTDLWRPVRHALLLPDRFSSGVDL